MNENTIEGGVDSSLVETQTDRQDEASDRPIQKEVKNNSALSVCWRGCLQQLLVLWLLVLFAVSTWSSVGCLSAYVLQSRYNHVVEDNKTANKLERDNHVYVQYLKLKNAVGILRKNNIGHKEPLMGDTQELSDLLNGKTYDPELLSLARAVTSLEDINLNLYNFFEIPRQFLILLLTMSMGVLGSLMRITRNYFNRNAEEEEAITWYLFRPLLGAITALAVLILLKAGQLTITNASVGEDNESLNPFFISFIAIISGFLSVQAHDRIRRAGATIFGTSKKLPVSRWLLNSRLKNLESKDLSSLASYLSVSEEKVKKWFDLEEAVPESYQPIVAAWLDEPPQILFTDLRPENKRASTVNSGTAVSESKETPEDKLQFQAQSDDTSGKVRDATDSKSQGSFDSSQTKDRWLIYEQVQPLIRSRKLLGLAHHSDVREETVKAWLDNKESVPPNVQPIVAAWLDAPEGLTLFTDVKPRERDNDPVSNE